MGRLVIGNPSREGGNDKGDELFDADFPLVVKCKNLSARPFQLPFPGGHVPAFGGECRVTIPTSDAAKRMVTDISSLSMLSEVDEALEVVRAKVKEVLS